MDTKKRGLMLFHVTTNDNFWPRPSLSFQHPKDSTDTAWYSLLIQTCHQKFSVPQHLFLKLLWSECRRTELTRPNSGHTGLGQRINTKQPTIEETKKNNCTQFLKFCLQGNARNTFKKKKT